jgi:hypothetical protein
MGTENIICLCEDSQGTDDYMGETILTYRILMHNIFENGNVETEMGLE